MNPIPVIAEIVHSVIARGDLAHLALALWAATDMALVVLLLRELAAANRRFDDFVRELARFNGRHEGTSTSDIPPQQSSGGET
jgi:hypothetical protein